MRTQSCTWGGVTATVYYFDKGEGLPLHQHPVEHTTMVLAGQTSVFIDDGSNPAFPMTPEDGSRILPANLPHAIWAMENGTVVLNMIVGGASGDGAPAGQPGGVLLEDGAVV